MAYRVAVVAVFHETNTFSPRPTDRASFRGWLRGTELAERHAGTRTVVGGLLDGARDHGLEAVPVFGAYATPSGTVTADALAAISQAVAEGLRGGFDGVLLELHGAMAAEGSADPEEEIADLVKRSVAGRPVAAVLDLHANLGTPRLAALDVLTGYRTNPHVDTYQRGRDAARLLSDVLAGRLRPVRAHRGVPLIAAPVAQRSDAEPLAGILGRARALEEASGLADVTVHCGYAYADVRHLGMGISVTADRARRDAAEEAAGALAELAWERRDGFRRELPPAAVAFADALGGPAPVAVTDTGDNVNGGAPGDATWLLAEAVAHPEVATLATLWDPDAVRAATRAGVGARIRLELGGRSAPSVGPPVPAEAEVLHLGEGTFTNRGPMATGATTSMGAVAVLRVGRCDVVVQQHPVQPNDPELFRSVGLEPAGYDVALLKGAAAVRAGWSGLVTRFVDAGTPGICDTRVDRFDYRRAPRPLWPLDQER